MTWSPEPEDDWQDAVEDALATAWGGAACGVLVANWMSGDNEGDWFTQPKKGRWVSDDR